jgi:hypothetical protein
MILINNNEWSQEYWEVRTFVGCKISSETLDWLNRFVLSKWKKYQEHDVLAVQQIVWMSWGWWVQTRTVTSSGLTQACIKLLKFWSCHTHTEQRAWQFPKKLLWSMAYRSGLFLSYFPVLRKEPRLISPCCPCLCICVPPLNFWTTWKIFTKFRMNVMPLEAIPTSYFLSFYDQQ